MANRVTRRWQIFTLAALLVTAGIVATTTPIRQAWSPLLARSLGQWFDPAGNVARVESGNPARPGSSYRDADLSPSTAMTPFPYTGRRSSSDASSQSNEVEGGAPRYGNGGSRDERGDRTVIVGYGGRRTVVGGAGAGGISGGGGAVGSRSDARRPESTPAATTENAPGRTVTSPAAPSNPPAPPNEAPEAPEAPKGGDPVESSPSPIFDEHLSGLDELTGTSVPNEGDGFAAFSAGDVAVNPEPSMLLLFGTGLAAAAGAIRRRMR